MRGRLCLLGHRTLRLGRLHVRLGVSPEGVVNFLSAAASVSTSPLPKAF